MTCSHKGTSLALSHTALQVIVYSLLSTSIPNTSGVITLQLLLLQALRSQIAAATALPECFCQVLFADISFIAQQLSVADLWQSSMEAAVWASQFCVSLPLMICNTEIVVAGPGSHYCEHIGRCHQSNRVFFVVNFLTGMLAQKCHDPECSHFRYTNMLRVLVGCCHWLMSKVWDAWNSDLCDSYN